MRAAASRKQVSRRARLGEQGQCVYASPVAFWRRPEKRSRTSCADSALRASESRMRAAASRKQVSRRARFRRAELVRLRFVGGFEKQGSRRCDSGEQGQCVCASSAALWRRLEKKSQISSANSELWASESRMRATASRSREAAAVIQASRVSASALRRRLSGEGRRRGRRFPARIPRRGLRR